jgi:hypothetical protein
VTDAVCTYFDRAYLPRGLVLLESLHRHWPGCALHVLALDEPTRAALERLRLPGVRVVPIAELERDDPELAAARRLRTRVGSYLTCTPSLVRHTLRATSAERVFYADADLCFFSSPRPAIAELDGGSVLIHRHRPAQPDWNPVAGTFNVGLVGFRRDERARTCVELWRRRCLEWCEPVAEPDRFGDQKYLDEWPGRVGGVVIARHRGIGVGPWNLPDSQVGRAPDGTPTIDGVPVICCHFSGLVAIATGLVQARFLSRMSAAARRHLYRPYLHALARQTRRIPGATPLGGLGEVAATDWPTARALIEEGMTACSLLILVGTCAV